MQKGVHRFDTVLRVMGALFLLLISAALVLAAFGHDATQLRAGTFGVGNWIFPGWLGVGGVTPTAMLTVDGNASINNTLYVTNEGRVGVGFSASTYNFGVTHDMEISGVGNAGSAGLKFTKYNWSNSSYDGAIDYEARIDSTGSSMKFRLNDGEAMRIDKNRNVGIGTAPGAYKLDVNGNANVNGAVYANTLYQRSGGTFYITAADGRTCRMKAATSCTGNYISMGGPSYGYYICLDCEP